MGFRRYEAFLPAPLLFVLMGGFAAHQYKKIYDGDEGALRAPSSPSYMSFENLGQLMFMSFKNPG
jgi:hypothetical protein